MIYTALYKIRQAGESVGEAFDQQVAAVKALAETQKMRRSPERAGSL